MQETEFKNLQIKDKLVFNGGEDVKIDGFTDGNTYTVLNFDDYGAGVEIIDDNSNEVIVCNYCVKTYFDKKHDKVNHPSHYLWLKDKVGIKVIDITRHMDFDLGNAIKYILRAGHKTEEGYDNKSKTIEDLKKAIWYINDKIKTIENEVN